MYPDEMNNSTQTGQLGVRPQGAPMNWKRLLSSVFWNSIWFSILTIAIYGVEGVLHLRPFLYILYVVTVIVVSLFNECLHILKSGGHQKFLRLYGISLLVSIISLFIFAFLGFGHSAVFLTVTGVMVALWAIPLPLALIFNRRQNEPT